MADSSAPPDLPELGEDEGRLMDFLSDTSFAAVADAVESAMALDLADLPEIDADVHLSSDAVFDPDGFVNQLVAEGAGEDAGVAMEGPCFLGCPTRPEASWWNWHQGFRWVAYTLGRCQFY